MATYNLKDIPTIPEDAFQLGNSYKMTGIYFMVRCIDGVLDTKYLLGWKPVGKSKATRLLSNLGTAVVMFEDQTGERTWFHISEEEGE